MAGKITFKNDGYKSRSGWVQVEFSRPSDAAIKEIKKILGREVLDAELMRIYETVSFMHGMKHAITPSKNQDTIRTLQAIATSSDNDALHAYAECDRVTRAEIQNALFLTGETQFIDHTGAKIRAAAALAGNCIQLKCGGRPVDGYRKVLALNAIRLWSDLGQTNMRISAKDEKSSPLVEFTAFLLWEIDPENVPDHSNIAKMLREGYRLNLANQQFPTP